MTGSIRLNYIDALKAIAILFMVQVHTIAIIPPNGVSLTHPLALLSAMIGGMAAPLFVTLSGWGVHAAVHRRLASPGLARWLVSRIILLVVLQLLVNLLLPQRFHWSTPGVLTLLALCALLTPLSVKLIEKPRFLLIFSILIAVSTLLPFDSGINWNWADRIASSSLLEWLHRLLFSGTYPLFPWWGFFLAGGLLKAKDNGNYLLISGSVAIGILLLTGVISMVTDKQWAITNGEGVLTFFPANHWFVLTAGAWAQFIWYCGYKLRHSANRLFTILAPAGKLSLSIYIVHFAILRLIVEYRPDSISMSESFIIALLHTSLWIPLAYYHQKKIPNFSIERLIDSIASSHHREDEGAATEQE